MKIKKAKMERIHIGKEPDANNKIGEVKEGERKLSVKEREEMHRRY